MARTPFRGAGRANELPTANERADAVLPATAAERRDAAVIALCVELDRLSRERLALFYGPRRIEDDDARTQAIEPIYRAQDRLLDRLCRTECATIVALVAKLHSLALFAESLRENPPDEGTPDRRLLGSVLRDALRLAGPV